MSQEFLSCNIWTNETILFSIFFFILGEEGKPSAVSEGNDYQITSYLIYFDCSTLAILTEVCTDLYLCRCEKSQLLIAPLKLGGVEKCIFG